MDQGEDKSNDNNMQQQQEDALMEQLRQQYLQQQVLMQQLIAQQQEAAQYQQLKRIQHFLWALQQQRQQYDNYQYSRFTSFLESDDSFFSPWSRNPNNHNQETCSVNSSYQPMQQRMVFQIGSFFSYNLFSPTNEAPDESEGSEKANSDIAT